MTMNGRAQRRPDASGLAGCAWQQLRRRCQPGAPRQVGARKAVLPTVPAWRTSWCRPSWGAGPSARERVDTATVTGPSSALPGCQPWMNRSATRLRSTTTGLCDPPTTATRPDGSTTITNAPDPSLNGSFQERHRVSRPSPARPTPSDASSGRRSATSPAATKTLADACTLAAMESALNSGFVLRHADHAGAERHVPLSHRGRR